MNKYQMEHKEASQLEDKALKTAAQFFGRDLLPLLGMKKKVVAIAPTEHIHLEARRLEEDFNFILQDASWLHLEFESDAITIRDLRRFREYEAYIGLTANVTVATMVLCSAGTKRLKDTLINGKSIYRVDAVRLKDREAEEVFDKLCKKREKGKRIRRYDLVPLLLLPLMSGELTVAERISCAIDVLRWEELDLSKENRQRFEAVLYTLAVKFLDQEELKKIKEKMGMTILGQMLWEDGIEQGMERGVREGIQRGIQEGLQSGIKQGEDRMIQLNRYLLENRRYEDLERASSDSEYRERLYQEFGL